MSQVGMAILAALKKARWFIAWIFTERFRPAIRNCIQGAFMGQALAPAKAWSNRDRQLPVRLDKGFCNIDRTPPGNQRRWTWGQAPTHSVGERLDCIISIGNTSWEPRETSEIVLRDILTGAPCKILPGSGKLYQDEVFIRNISDADINALLSEEVPLSMFAEVIPARTSDRDCGCINIVFRVKAVCDGRHQRPTSGVPAPGLPILQATPPAPLVDESEVEHRERETAEKAERDREVAEEEAGRDRVEQEEAERLRKECEAEAKQKQAETDRLAAEAPKKKRLADEAERPERELVEAEKTARLETFNRIAAELGYEPTRIDNYQNWANFDESRVREYIGQRLVQRQIHEAAEKAGVNPNNSLKLAVFVVRGHATVNRIIELLKNGLDYQAIKTIVTSDEVTNATSETGLADLQKARLKIEKVAAEAGYTPEIGGDGFRAKIDSFATQLAFEKGIDTEQTILDARKAFAAVVTSARMGEEK